MISVSDPVDVNSPLKPIICWFRDDLRVTDNPALSAACEAGAEVLCLYIYEGNGAQRPLGGAANWFLHGALKSLADKLAECGAKLHIFRGDPSEILPRLAADVDAGSVVWNRRYNLAEREADAALKLSLKNQNVDVRSFNGHLLFEPWEVKTQTGGPMRVFTPFWRAARAVRDVTAPYPAPAKIKSYNRQPNSLHLEITLDELDLVPTRPDWSGGMQAEWHPGEDGAKARLASFLDGAIKGYGNDRNLPGKLTTSRLSPHLRFGDIGVRQIWAATMARVDSGELEGYETDVQKFTAELGWREFSYHLLFHFPTLPTANYQSRFDQFPWVSDAEKLKAWQRGMTGYPIVDAGMRELWQTGWMHNRVRMVVASFLIKHLMIDWREGEKWFWDTLCDADHASNSASWQWVAGSGADAAPFFRIFNPITQGEKFDTDAAYVRRFVPELAKLPQEYIHKPWTASLSVLAAANVRLGETYPRPIINHEFARDRALAAFKSINADPA